MADQIEYEKNKPDESSGLFFAWYLGTVVGHADAGRYAMEVTYGSLGPVGTEAGFTPCRFTGKFDSVAVEGTYDPAQTRSEHDGSTKTVITVKDTVYAATLGPIGPNGLCGSAEQI